MLASLAHRNVAHLDESSAHVQRVNKVIHARKAAKVHARAKKEEKQDLVEHALSQVSAIATREEEQAKAKHREIEAKAEAARAQAQKQEEEEELEEEAEEEEEEMQRYQAVPEDDDDDAPTTLSDKGKSVMANLLKTSQTTQHKPHPKAKKA